MFRPLKMAAAIVLAILTLPFAIVAGIFSEKRKCTPLELASDLRRLANGNYDGWDRLERVAIQDRRLETIRIEAVIAVNLPLQPGDGRKLRYLADKAAALSLK